MLRVRTLPDSATTPSRTSMTGLIESMLAEHRLRAADATTPAQVLERVERAEEAGARPRSSVRPVDDRVDVRALLGHPAGGDALVAESHRHAHRVDDRDRAGRPRAPSPPPAPTAWCRRAGTRG